MMGGRIVLAFSGGEGSTAALAALRRSSAEVVAVVVDVGQQRGLDGVRERATSLGAIRAHVIDAREEFLERHVLPVLQAGHFADTTAAADPAVLHPLIARIVCNVASMEDAAAIAHGAEAGGPTADRLEQLFTGCGFHGPVIAQDPRASTAPVREAHVAGWARMLGGSGTAPASGDRAAYLLTRDPAASAGSAAVAISFAAGRPTAVNGVALSLGELVEVVTTIAGDHGVGRVASTDAAPARWVVAEAPAAVVLSAAFDGICEAAAGRDALDARSALAPAFRAVLDDGRWHAPAGEAIRAFLGALASRVSGTTHLDLRHGECHVNRVDVEPASAVTPVARPSAH